MRSHELVLGRAFGVTFDHGDDFFDALAKFCADNGVRQGYIPGFIAGFSDVEIVGTCEKLANPDAPVWSHVHLTNVEVLGSGTLAPDDDGAVRPHIHVTVGLKEHSATAHTSHLLKAQVQFLTELLVIEVTSPNMRRRPERDLYDVPLLHFAAATTAPDPA